jgi:hypothetical protein
MIEITGEEGTREYEAAVAVRDAISKLWPGIDTTPTDQDHVRIAANVKISGYRVSDIDVVVCGSLSAGRRFVPRRPLNDMDGGKVLNKPVAVHNFVIAVEVKDHSESSVQLVGDKVNVKYSRGGRPKWKSATDQNIAQVHALSAYLQDNGVECYVHRCLLMLGLNNVSVDGALPAGFNGGEFFAELAATARLRKSGTSFHLSSGRKEQVDRTLDVSIFRPVVPSSLDRKRMDRIASRSVRVNELLPLFGSKLIQLRGHGGTGKTVMLLQLAWRKYRENGNRTLVLTYNHALAADIRRLLTLLGVPTSPEEGGIAVDTVMSFMYSWFAQLQLLEDEELDIERYKELCATAHAMLIQGAINDDDVNEIISANPDKFDFDRIVVDESQDWPQHEADLLKALYRPTRLCLADGIDQLVRGKRTSWGQGLQDEERLVVPLDRCLRMKRNLAMFANELANAAGLGWNLSPSDEAGGGRIILLSGSYSEYPSLHDELLESARAQGNAEVDFLFCVPPSGVTETSKGRGSKIGQHLAHRGFSVWDGVDERVRRDFPRSLDSYRVVQYASCRGLEGWVVILDSLDAFWKECHDERTRRGLDDDEKAAFEDLEKLSNRAAWRWTLIPLTRPIDTLVISLKDISSPFAKAMLSIAKDKSDLVEYYAMPADFS